MPEYLQNEQAREERRNRLRELRALADHNQAEVYKRFPSTSVLGHEEWCLNFMDWVTFYRRNIHLFARDYLGLKSLYWYQLFYLYEMGKSNKTVAIATRSSAKTFLTAIYACCMAILYPGIKIVVSSAQLAQGALIITEKIQKELWHMSPALRREIGSERNIKKESGWHVVKFLNGSSIQVVPASDAGRGSRSNCLIRDEFRLINKKCEDEVLSPFQVSYMPPFVGNDEYPLDKDIVYTMSDVYLSSSWLDDGNWMWGLVDQTAKDMLNGDKVVLMSVDEAAVIYHNIKPMSYMIDMKRKLDPLTWQLEILNERVKENQGAYFTYKMLSQNQKPYMPFYPRRPHEIKAGKKNPYFTKKANGEIRVVGVDLSFISGKQNDASVFTCMAGIPEMRQIEINGEITDSANGYRRRVDYIYSMEGGDIDSQAVFIRRLYEEYGADYIVLDTRSGGVAVYDKLAKPLYDSETGKNYSPLRCMNIEEYANRIQIPGAEPRIYAVNATSRLNSEIAISFRSVLIDKMIDFPLSLNAALDEVLPNIQEYMLDDTGDIQNFYETPFLETQALISECNALTYKKDSVSGIITVKETGNNRKDHYSSASYSSFYIGLLEKDLLSDNSEYEPGIFIS